MIVDRARKKVQVKKDITVAFFNGQTIDEAIKALESLKTKYSPTSTPKFHAEAVKDRYSSMVVGMNLYITHERDENDDEYNTRIVKEDALYKKKMIAYDKAKAKYEQLKKEIEGIAPPAANSRKITVT